MPNSWERQLPIDDDQRSAERTAQILLAQAPLLSTATLGLPGLSVPTGLVRWFARGRADCLHQVPRRPHVSGRRGDRASSKVFGTGTFADALINFNLFSFTKSKETFVNISSLFRQLLAGLVLGVTALQVGAQIWPAKPITMIVPWPAGGPSDFVARKLQPEMAKALGQPVVIDNIGGAGGAIGIQKNVGAAADGYTMSLASPLELIVAPLTASGCQVQARGPQDRGSDRQGPAGVVGTKGPAGQHTR